MICKEESFVVKFQHKEDITFQRTCINVRSLISKFVPYLSKYGTAEAVFAFSEVNQQKLRVSLVTLQFRSECFSYIVYRSESGNHRRYRRRNGLLTVLVLPSRFHRERVLPYGNGYAERQT